MDSTTPQTPYDLDTRLNTINELAKTAHERGRWQDGDRLFELAFKLLGVSANAKPEASPEPKKEEPIKPYVSKFKYPPCGPDCLLCYPSPELPKVCADLGCGIYHPWNKEVE